MKSISFFILIFPTFSFAASASSISFVDQVIGLALEESVAQYRVALKQHAAYYHASKKDQSVLNCLKDSIEKKLPAHLDVNGKTLQILKCRD